MRRTTECGRCGGALLEDIGQFVRSGRLGWGIDTDCAGCSLVSCGDEWGPAPASVRRALLAEHGTFAVRPAGPAVSLVGLLRALREDGTRSLAEARRLADELAATGLTGTLVEMEFLAERLRHRGVAAVVGPAGAGPGQDSAGR
ncbi:hypothetical protein [Kitasatospora sp. DSM 101779]|uniref:hypothetical protein n=1 Tax=Kitasatospora sp. DSM 101779 TaxID=2853165 RepID=UPI0021D817C9|nr:hypothetical protein [Kitasatospora sp. DSM 101779]MCU7826027.1 hypothetical protein [Kitasatospora sp. DSM 101779]